MDMFNSEKFVTDIFKICSTKYPELASSPNYDFKEIKEWEIVIQDAIENQLDDECWWEVYDGNIFEELCDAKPGDVVKTIKETLEYAYPPEEDSSLDTEAKDMSAAKDVQDTPATGHDKDKGAI